MTPFVSDPDFTLHVGDALEVLQTMPAESVHCCVTSPPYWGLRDYGTEGQLGLEPTPDQYVTNMVKVFREVRRVLRSDGTCWINLGDSYCSQPNQRVKKPGGRTDTAGWKQDSNAGSLAQGDSYVPGLKPKDLIGVPWRLAFALQADGWYLRSDIIWAKPNPMPESVTDRPTKAHEYLFLLTKSPRYFYDADAIREPAEWARWGDQTNGKHEGSESAAGWIGSKTYEELKGSRRGTDDYQSGGVEKGATWAGSTPGVMHPGGRNKRSVWEIATEPYPDAHFATFPQALVEPCVKAGSSERVCADCGRPITSLEWSHGSSTTDLRRVSDDLHQPESEVLLEDLREQSHSAESSIDARVHNGEGIQATSSAGPSNGESRGVRDGASPSDGEGAGPDAVEGRGRASQERDQGRQPHIESRSDAEASTRSQTQTAEEADHLSALRRRDHHVWSCPACGCRETTAGVILDCFLGSGTTAQVARRLGRRSIGIELNPEYAQLAARRLQQQSLFATETAEA